MSHSFNIASNNKLWVHLKNGAKPRSINTNGARSCAPIAIRSAPGRSKPERADSVLDCVRRVGHLIPRGLDAISSAVVMNRGGQFLLLCCIAFAGCHSSPPTGKSVARKPASAPAPAAPVKRPQPEPDREKVASAHAHFAL